MQPDGAFVQLPTGELAFTIDGEQVTITPVEGTDTYTVTLSDGASCTLKRDWRDNWTYTVTRTQQDESAPAQTEATEVMEQTTYQKLQFDTGTTDGDGNPILAEYQIKAGQPVYIDLADPANAAKEYLLYALDGRTFTAISGYYARYDGDSKNYLVIDLNACLLYTSPSPRD